MTRLLLGAFVALFSIQAYALSLVAPRPSVFEPKVRNERELPAPRVAPPDVLEEQREEQAIDRLRKEEKALRERAQRLADEIERQRDMVDQLILENLERQRRIDDYQDWLDRRARNPQDDFDTLQDYLRDRRQREDRREERENR